MGLSLFFMTVLTARKRFCLSHTGCVSNRIKPICSDEGAGYTVCTVPKKITVSKEIGKTVYDVIRECTDIQKLTPTLVNTLIKKIEISNSVKGEDGKKHVPITIHFRSVDIVTVPDEEEIIAAMEEIRNTPTKVA